MSELVDKIKWALYGNIYTDTFENPGDGGPQCAAEMTNEFRIALSSISAVIQLLTVYFAQSYVKKSRECDLSLVKNLKPNFFEKLVAYCSIFTLLVMVYYKIITGRLIFMLNPCHIVLTMQSYLLLTKKTQFGGLLFISYLRWIFGPWFALMFPDYDSFQLPFEIEFFYIEHYLAAFIGPITLIASGRYGFFKQSLFAYFVQQQWGFAYHVLQQRLINSPISMLTWGNINYNLCKAAADPFLPLVGQYYLYFVDHYLNSASILCLIGVIVLSYIVIIIIKGFQKAGKLLGITQKEKKQ